MSPWMMNTNGDWNGGGHIWWQLGQHHPGTVFRPFFSRTIGKLAKQMPGVGEWPTKQEDEPTRGGLEINEC
jgi:hypothetical protein